MLAQFGDIHRLQPVVHLRAVDGDGGARAVDLHLRRGRFGELTHLRSPI
jgi:hypothetical protein